jgi:peptide/nickel transport system ATP-binding protein
MTSSTLLVDDLHTHFFTKAGVSKAVDGVSFRIEPGEIMGLVGESGSGKSMTGNSILGLVDPPGRIVEGRILFKGQDLRRMSQEQLRGLRGNRIAMIYQDPMMTLNPVLRIDTQMIEAVVAHQRVSKSAAREQAREALARVGIASPEERLQAYPHQFSGGMRQRVAIAIALLNKPDLIIADEPTTALDVTIQGQILFEIQRLCTDAGTSLIWITHDLAVVAGLADCVAVMYAGKIVEQGTVQQVIETPQHPYSRALMDSIPSRNVRGGLLQQIPGMPPSSLNRPQGCSFRARCARASAICSMEPVLTVSESGHALRCFHPFEETPLARPVDGPAWHTMQEP